MLVGTLDDRGLLHHQIKLFVGMPVAGLIHIGALRVNIRICMPLTGLISMRAAPEALKGFEDDLADAMALQDPPVGSAARSNG